MSYAQAKATKDACHLLVAADWLRDCADTNVSATTTAKRSKKTAKEGKKERKKMAKGLLQCEAIVRQVGDTCTVITLYISRLIHNLNFDLVFVVTCVV